MSAIDVMQRVEELGGELLVCDGRLMLRSEHPLPQELLSAVRDEKLEIMIALATPIDASIRATLGDLRPALPVALRNLPDDRLMCLVNWSILRAWEEAVQRTRSLS